MESVLLTGTCTFVGHLTLIERTNRPRRREVCRLMNFVSEVIPMWIKVGVSGSVVWTFLCFLVSRQGMHLVKNFDFAWFNRNMHGHRYDDSLTLVISGIAIIWLLSFLFVRKKPTD